MDLDHDDFIASLKALGIFSNLRANLALAEAFSRRSFLEAANYSGWDMRLLGKKPGQEQMEVHNWVVGTTFVALMYSVLDTYFALKRALPRLEDRDLEDYLNGLDDRESFLRGMANLRNAVFHVKSDRAWRNGHIAHFSRICAARGGAPAVMGELQQLLYRFTQKCFHGELKIWPLFSYKEIKRWEREHADLLQKLEGGEIEFHEFMEAIMPAAADSV